jgi:hypothetical protein
MNPDQEEALDNLRAKYEVGGVASHPDGRVSVEIVNGATPYFFIDVWGAIEDEDGCEVNV